MSHSDHPMTIMLSFSLHHVSQTPKEQYFLFNFIKIEKKMLTPLSQQNALLLIQVILHQLTTRLNCIFSSQRQVKELRDCIEAKSN